MLPWRVTTLVVRWATGLLRLIQGRFEEALAGLTEAQRLKSLLGKEVRTIEPRGVMLQAQVRMGKSAEASAALAELYEDQRDRALVRIAAAEIHLAQDDPEAALEVLAPVIEGTSRAAHPTTSSIDALLFEALARARLGDARATEEAIERALELAEREGIIVPFAVAPVGELLERHPRQRTTHAAFLSEILDVLNGGSAEAPARPAFEELSGAELRVVRFLPSNLKAPEIAAELFVSPNTVRTHLRHIYAKLGAHSRAEAVERARGLGLLAPSRFVYVAGFAVDQLRSSASSTLGRHVPCRCA